MKEREPFEIDEGNVTIVSHICIRDPDTGEIIIEKDIFEKKNDATDTR